MSEKKILGVMLLIGLLLMSQKPSAVPPVGDYIDPAMEPEPKKPTDMPPSVSGRNFLKKYKTA